LTPSVTSTQVQRAEDPYEVDAAGPNRRRSAGLAAVVALAALALPVATNGASADQSADADQLRGSASIIAFNHKEDLWTIREDGSGKKRILKNDKFAKKDNAGILHPSFAPDGSRIAFNVHEVLRHVLNVSLWTARPNGKGARRIHSERSPDDEHSLEPSFGGGSQIALPGGIRKELDRGIRMIGADGSGMRTVFTMSERRSHINSSPALSADGTKLAFGMWSKVLDVFGNRGFVAGSDGSGVTAITPSFNTPIEGPTFSPDGTRVAFSGLGEPGNPRTRLDIYMVNVDGSGLVNVTNSPKRRETDPSFSPDGTRLVFESCSGCFPEMRPPGSSGSSRERHDLRIHDLAGGASRKLTPGIEPTWAPVP
jgi:Tol biopolymer transport system component